MRHASAMAAGDLSVTRVSAGADGLRAIVTIDVPEAGLYSLEALLAPGDGQRWLVDGCRKAMVCPAGAPGWRPVLAQVLAKGRHLLVVTLAGGASLDRLRVERKKDAASDYVAALRRLGFDAGPEGPVSRATALEAARFVREKRRDRLAGCGDTVPRAPAPPSQVAQQPIAAPPPVRPPVPPPGTAHRAAHPPAAGAGDADAAEPRALERWRSSTTRRRRSRRKLVYYGPGLCGKTTNLQWIHGHLAFKSKGKIVSLSTQTDRTLFFDFLPVELGTVRGHARAHADLHGARTGVLRGDAARGAEGLRRRRLRGRQPGGDARRERREPAQPATEPARQRDRPRDPAGHPVQQARPADGAARAGAERAAQPAQPADVRGRGGERHRRRGDAARRHEAAVPVARALLRRGRGGGCSAMASSRRRPRRHRPTA